MTLRIILIALVIAVSISLNGCYKVFAIFVSQTSDGIVTFRFEPNKKALNKGVYIRELWVERARITDQKPRMVWSIKTESGRLQKVYTITYSVVPSGFEEDVRVPAQPLILGGFYSVVARGDERVGIAEFEYGKDGNVYPRYNQH